MQPATLLFAAVLLGATFAGCLGDSASQRLDSFAPNSPPPETSTTVDASDEPSAKLVPGPLPLLSGDSIKTLAQVRSFDGHLVPVTLYQPTEAKGEVKVPVILHSHGWSGSRAKDDNAFREYHKAGFGVVSIDMRGHGDARSTSEARVHHMDYEIKDVQAVIDHVATLDWVILDAPGDPLVGAIGGSYGGGYQLLTAIQDPRLDAIAPDITWNNLVHSLAPNGAPKSAWIDLLYAGGNLNARVDPMIHQAYTIVQTQNRVPDGSMPYEPNIKAQFLRSSPASYPDRIQIPTLLTQGANDTLFNVNEAIHNYELISTTGAPVYLTTHLGGHILNTRGTIPIPAPTPVGLQGPAGPSPCGNLRNLTLSFFQRHLTGLAVDVGSPVCLALEDGSAVRGERFPLANTTDTEFPLSAQLKLQQAVPGSLAEASVLKVTENTLLAGLPTLKGNFSLTNTMSDAIVYFSLKVVSAGGSSRILHYQVTPVRLAYPTALDDKIQFEIELSGVAAQLKPGDSLVLVASTVNDQYAHNFGRVPNDITLFGLVLTLPVVPASA